MPGAGRGHSVTLVFILLILCLAAFSALTALLLGVDIYRGVAEDAEAAYGERTCLAYVAAKLRRADRAAAIGLGSFGESDSLEITEYFDDVEYVTKIYLYKGNVCELFYEKALDLPPEAGLPVCPARGLNLGYGEGGLLRLECDAGSGPVAMYVRPRSGLSEAAS